MKTRTNPEITETGLHPVKSALVAAMALLFAGTMMLRGAELLLNGSFDDNSAWTVVPAESTSWTCIANGEANLHPVVPSPPYIGPVITQTLSVPGAGGKKLHFAAVMSSPAHPAGNTIAFQLEYLDTTDITRQITIANPDNNSILTLTSITTDLVLPPDAKTITKFLVTKTYTGMFTLQSVSLDMLTPLLPVIAVEQPAGTGLANQGTKAYGSVLVGSSKSLTFTIRNSGNANLTGIAVTKDGVNAADFTVTAAPAVTLAPGATTLFMLKFIPGATGSRTAALHIANSDSTNNPFNVNLTGTGIAPSIAVEQPAGTGLANPGSKDYGNVLVGSSKSLSFTIRNSGTSNLTGIAITKDGVNAADFTVTAAPAVTLAPGASTSFGLKFTPGSTGGRTAAIHIASSDSSKNPFNVSLTGTGTAPSIAVEQPAGTGLANAGSKDYGNVLVGSSKSLSFTIRNSGTSNLTGIAVTKDGVNAADFTVTAAPAVTLAPGASTSFGLKFTPGATGSRTAAIHIASSDSSKNPFNVSLTGTGTAPSIAVEQPAGTGLVNPGTKDYGNVPVGSSKSLTFTIRNSGTGNLTGIAVTKDGVNAADFTVTAAPALTLAPGATTLFMLKFTPGASGNRIAVIHIASSDSTKNPFNVNLTGIGTAPALMAADNTVVSATLPTPTTTAPADTWTTLITVNPVDGLKHLTLVVTKAPGTAGQRRIVEVSPNLVDWYSGGNYTTILQDDETLLKVRDNTPLTPGVKRYIRLK